MSADVLFGVEPAAAYVITAIAVLLGGARKAPDGDYARDVDLRAVSSELADTRERVARLEALYERDQDGAL